jgi:hypothetical protein
MRGTPDSPPAQPLPPARGARLAALLLALLALLLGLRVPLAGGRSVALGVIVGLVAGAVALVLGLGARTQALQAGAPVGWYTAAVALAVAGTLLCTLWVVLLFAIAPILHGATG